MTKETKERIIKAMLEDDNLNDILVGSTSNPLMTDAQKRESFIVALTKEGYEYEEEIADHFFPTNADKVAEFKTVANRTSNLLNDLDTVVEEYKFRLIEDMPEKIDDYYIKIMKEVEQYLMKAQKAFDR